MLEILFILVALVAPVALVVLVLYFIIYWEDSAMASARIERKNRKKELKDKKRIDQALAAKEKEIARQEKIIDLERRGKALRERKENHE